MHVPFSIAPNKQWNASQLKEKSYGISVARVEIAAVCRKARNRCVYVKNVTNFLS